MSTDSTAPQRISIVIVDDDASIRVSLQRLCDVYGLSATAFASGRDFLAALEHSAPRPDCLLLDAHMPGMTGSELHRALRARGVHIPTIVFTADDAPELSAHYAIAGIVACLRKPLGAEDLLAAIDQAVGSRNSTA